MNNNQEQADSVLIKICEYVHEYVPYGNEVLEIAKVCLLDSLGCAMLGLQDTNCRKLLGPIIPGTLVPGASRVPGTNYGLDPILATFNTSSMIRWLDFNDTWLAAEWGHPSDNIGAILSVADYMSQKKSVKMREVLYAIIKAYEIQGILALENAFNKVGLDHVILVKIASAAISSLLLGATTEQTMSAISNAWIDGHSLRTYRHGIHTGSRKSWAAGDAASRGVRLAWLAMLGEPGYMHAIAAKKWGFSDVYWKGEEIKLPMPFAHYVIDNILFKVKYPAEFHGQTAVEAAIALHPYVKDKIAQIERIEITTQSAAMRIINKTGVLRNYADRDHCLQYMVVLGLIYGNITSESYSDVFANSNSQIDMLRNTVTVVEDPEYSKAYLDPQHRAIANSVQVFFFDGTSTDKVEILYPLGHKRRRSDAIPFLHDKYVNAVAGVFEPAEAEKLNNLWHCSINDLCEMQVHEFISLWVK